MMQATAQQASNSEGSWNDSSLQPEWLEDACLGRGLPAEAEQHLRSAGASYHDDETALEHLNAAQRIVSDHPAVLIGFYRFYFYKNRLEEALGIAKRCLVRAATDNRLAEDWRKVQPGDADFFSFDAILPRFFLFTLKGYAYLQLRLGDLEEGRAALEKLLELDPADRLGGKVLVNVLERHINGDDD